MSGDDDEAKQEEQVPSDRGKRDNAAKTVEGRGLSLVPMMEMAIEEEHV